MEPFERPLGFNFGTRLGQIGTQINKSDKSSKNNEKKSLVELLGEDGGEQTEGLDNDQKREHVIDIEDRRRFNKTSGPGGSSGGVPSIGNPTIGAPILSSGGSIYMTPAGPSLPPNNPTSGGVNSKVRRRVGTPIVDVPLTDDPTIDRRNSGGGGTRQGSSGEPKKSTKITDLGKEGGYVPLPPGVDRYADRLPPQWEKCTIPNPTPGPGGSATIEVDCCKEGQKEKIQELFASIINDPLIRERGQRFLWCITGSNHWARTDGETRNAWTDLRIECVDGKLPDSYNRSLDADQNRKLKLSLDQIENMNKYDLLKILLVICSNLTSSGKYIYLDYIMLTSRNITPELLTNLLLEAKPDAKNGDRLFSDYFIWDSATGIVYARDYNGSLKYPLLKNLPWKK